MATFREIVTDIYTLTAGRLHPNVIKSIVNRAQVQIAEAYDWSFLHVNGVINTVAPKTQGSVSVSRGTQIVIGSGTSFDELDAGSFLWLGGINLTPVPVDSVTSPTQLVLRFPWAGPDIVDRSYVLAPLYYVVPNSLEIRAVRAQEYLTKVTREQLNLYDPIRQAHGSDPSLHWAYGPVAPNGDLTVELWPIPASYKAYLVEYKMRPEELIDDGQISRIPYELLEYKSLNTAFMQLYAASGQASYKQLADDYMAMYQRSLEEVQTQDRRRMQHRSQVTREGAVQSWVRDHFVATHDLPPIVR